MPTERHSAWQIHTMGLTLFTLLTGLLRSILLLADILVDFSAFCNLIEQEARTSLEQPGAQLVRRFSQEVDETDSLLHEALPVWVFHHHPWSKYQHSQRNGLRGESQEKMNNGHIYLQQGPVWGRWRADALEAVWMEHLLTAGKDSENIYIERNPPLERLGFSSLIHFKIYSHFMWTVRVSHGPFSAHIQKKKSMGRTERYRK